MSHSICEVRSNTDVSRGRGQDRYECDINYIVYSIYFYDDLRDVGERGALPASCYYTKSKSYYYTI